MARIPFPDREPCFFKGDDGSVQFQFIIDERNVIGPRPARVDDVRNHGRAWQAFCRESPCTEAQMLAIGFSRAIHASAPTIAPEEHPVPQDAGGDEVAIKGNFHGADPAKFDHDNSGEPGGSLPKPKPPTPKPAKRAYKRRTAK